MQIPGLMWCNKRDMAICIYRESVVESKNNTQ